MIMLSNAIILNITIRNKAMLESYLIDYSKFIIKRIYATDYHCKFEYFICPAIHMTDMIKSGILDSK